MTVLWGVRSDLLSLVVADKHDTFRESLQVDFLLGRLEFVPLVWALYFVLLTDSLGSTLSIAWYLYDGNDLQKHQHP